MSETVVANMECSQDGETYLKLTIEGKTDMPFWKHDLKLLAVKELLSTVDRKDFYEANKIEEFHRNIEEIREILEAIEY